MVHASCHPLFLLRPLHLLTFTSFLLLASCALRSQIHRTSVPLERYMVSRSPRPWNPSEWDAMRLYRQETFSVLRCVLISSLLLSSVGAFTTSTCPPCDPRDPTCTLPPASSTWRYWRHRRHWRQVPVAFAPGSYRQQSQCNARISGPSSSGDNSSRKDNDDNGDEDDKDSISKKIESRLSTLLESDERDRELTLAEEKEYKVKLAEAERAIAEAEVARKKLLLAKNGGSLSGVGSGGSASSIQASLAPTSLRSDISRTDAGTLVINVPPVGLKAESILPGVFSLVWFSAIIPATFAGGIGSALFLLPFWASGGLVAKLAFYDPFLGGELSIGRYAWSLKGTYAGIKKKEKDGATKELRGAAAEVALYVNEVPRGELRLYGERGMLSLGLGLPFDELEYLAGEINQHLSDLKETNDEDPLYEGVL